MYTAPRGPVSQSLIDCILHPSIDQLQNSEAFMEEFHCAATMDDDQEGDWREFLQKWDVVAAATAADDHIGLAGSSMQQPTFCSSLLNVHGSLAMESLNPNSNGLPPSISLGLPSPHSFIPASLSPPPASLEAPDNLISTVRQQDESSDISRSSWFSDFLQSLQSHHVTSTGLASSYNIPLNIGDANQRGAAATSQININLYSNPEGLEELMNMEQMNNSDFINYGAVGSLHEQLSNALGASDMTGAELKLQSEVGTSMSGVLGSGTEEAEDVQTLLFTPASSVSSDGGPEDDSDSHEDMKDVGSSLEGLDDMLVAGDQQSKLNMPSSLPSSDTHSSKVTPKLLHGETSAGPSSSHIDQDKKRASKSARATKKPKRERGAKLAIKIQSDVEVLDDGYKWRKYGQKAVKNSPFPRSYYKCTDKQCKVKKHVERQAHEPDYVVTTYEGVHNHSRPDQQVQVLHSQSDIATQQHDSFQAFVPTPSTHLLSPMDLFSLRSSSLFQAESQPMALPVQQATPSPQQTIEVDQGILQNLLHGEPRRSSV